MGMTPGERARKREQIERMQEAGIKNISLRLEDALYLLDCADIPEAEERLAALQAAAAVTAEVDAAEARRFEELYENEKVRADNLQVRYDRAKEKIATLSERRKE